MKIQYPGRLFLYTGLRSSTLLLLFIFFLTTHLQAQEKINTALISTNLLVSSLQQKEKQPPVLPAPASAQWYQHAIENIKAKEYAFQLFGTGGLYSVVNHAQHLGFLFNASGYTVKNFSDNESTEKTWEYNFHVQSINKEGCHTLTSPLRDKIAAPQSLAFVYDNYSIEYLNNEEGMRQNFIVSNQPQGKGRLQVTVNLNGSLEPVVENNNQLLLYTATDKKVKLAYDQLKVWDASHRLLPASMQLISNNQLVISVDDKDAVYPVTIDPLNHLPDWTANGQGLLFPLLNDLTAHVLYGFAVSSAGDINGDGKADLLIGVPAYVQIVSIAGNSFNPVALGAAFIYYGSPSGASLTPNEVLQPSSSAGALAGYSVSSAGDVDGDGKSDVIVGAPGDKINISVLLMGTVSVATGKAYIYYGSSFDGNVNTISAPSVSLSPVQADFGSPAAAVPANPLYGFSVGSAGDVNADSYSDVIVGSPAYFDLGTLNLSGRVDVYHGSNTGIGTTPATKIKGGSLNGLFGFSVSTAGKVNNDVYSDIVVGAPASAGIVALGAVYIFHGSAAGITAISAAGANTTLQAPGLLNQTLFGYSVSNAGDVNGDGKDDVIVGEPLSLETTLALQVVAVGQAHIFYGSNTGIVTAGPTHLTSPRSPNLLGLMQGNLLYGFSVSGAGDINCDGLADVVVGEPGGTAISLGTGVLGLVSTNVISGNVYAYAGKSGTGPVNSPMLTFQETGVLSVANLLGASVGNAGDVNGDGHPDLIVGAPNGTLNLASSITGIIGSALNYLTVNSVGSAYVWLGCNFSLLPSHLLSFDGKELNGDALLSWVTTGSEANDHFEIERSIDGISFAKIGNVQAIPANGNKETYSFTDKILPAQTNYYRLKMLNTDAKASYSKVVLVTKSGSYVSALRVSPNPAHETVQLHFNYIPIGNFTLLMINTSGQVVLKTNITVQNSIYEMKRIDRTAAMPAGTYFIRLVGKKNQTAASAKVILD